MATHVRNGIYFSIRGAGRVWQYGGFNCNETAKFSH